MKLNKRSWATIFLILGMVCLSIGLIQNNTLFSYAAIVLVLLSLVLGGRWMRPRKR